MCGIYGAVAIDAGCDLRSERETFAEMDARLSHRGPDDSGFHLSANGRLALGHRRLSIVDVSRAGRQPLWNEEQTVGMVFNGEIYNYVALRRELEPEHRFSSATDSEVIVHGYESYGADVVSKLDGMFAFAVWDTGRDRLLLARDRLGKKPLYYAEAAGALFFASDLRTLLSAAAIRRTVDPTAVRDYLTYGYVASPKTMLRGVRKLSPGELLTCERGQIRTAAYWKLPAVIGNRSESRADSIRAVRSLVARAVEKRLIGDVPVAALLSGGIDSTVVVSTMARVSPGPVSTFTVGFSAGAASAALNHDFEAARRTAKRLGTDHHELFLNPDRDNLRRLLQESIVKTGEPNANPTMISTFAIAEAVKQAGIKVVLTGDGGDELFAGYPRYLFDRWAERAGRMPALIRLPAEKLLAQLPQASRVIRARRFLRKAAVLPGLDPGARYLTWRQVVTDAEQVSVLNPDLLASADGYVAAEIAAAAVLEPSAPSMRDRMAYADLKLWVADESNLRLDRSTMASGVEARCPFLDVPLAEYMLSLPFEAKVNGGRTKALLRDAFASELPEDIVAARKRGFLSPARSWVQETLAATVDEVLSPVRVERVGLLSPHAVETLRRNARAPKKLWSLVVLQLWGESFLQ